MLNVPKKLHTSELKLVSLGRLLFTYQIHEQRELGSSKFVVILQGRRWRGEPPQERADAIPAISS